MPDTDDSDAKAPAVPLMPTGNGVTDLEIAREQAAVADADADESTNQTDDGDDPVDRDRPTLSE